MTTISSSPSHSPTIFATSSSSRSPQLFARTAKSPAASPRPLAGAALPSGSGTASAPSASAPTPSSPGQLRRYPRGSGGGLSASPRFAGRAEPARHSIGGKQQQQSKAQTSPRNASAARLLESEATAGAASAHSSAVTSPAVKAAETAAAAKAGDTPEARETYRDSGTQYTPPGLPPTASSADLARLRGHPPPAVDAQQWSMQAGAGAGAGGRAAGSVDGGERVPGSSARGHGKGARAGGLGGEDVEMDASDDEGGGSSISSSDSENDEPRADKGKARAAEDVDMASPPPEAAAPTASSSSASMAEQLATKRVATPSSLSSSPLAPLSPTLSKRARPDAEETWKALPRDYMQCSPADLGLIISDMLSELILINDKMPPKTELTRFHSRAPPSISVKDYLERLIFHATLSQSILLSMVYYIDRLCSLYPNFTITSLTVHRFLITAATVAAKGLCDSFWTNHTYARVGGVSTKELAMLELEFLGRMDWSIVPPAEMLEDYYSSLVGRAEGFVLEDERPPPPQQQQQQQALRAEEKTEGEKGALADQ